MTILTPNFNIPSPSPATKAKDLGQELLDFANSVDQLLATFEYNGTDPTAVVSRVNALEVWRTAVETYLTDTGWQTLTLNDPYSEFNAATPLQVRRIGKRVHLRGRIVAESASGINSNVIAAVLPPEFRPPRRVYFLVKGSNLNYVTLDIRESGNFSFYYYRPDSTATTPNMFIDHSWLVD